MMLWGNNWKLGSPLLGPRLFTIMVPMSDTVTIWSPSQGSDFFTTFRNSKNETKAKEHVWGGNWKDREPFIGTSPIHDHGFRE